MQNQLDNIKQLKDMVNKAKELLPEDQKKVLEAKQREILAPFTDEQKKKIQEFLNS